MDHEEIVDTGANNEEVEKNPKQLEMRMQMVEMSLVKTKAVVRIMNAKVNNTDEWTGERSMKRTISASSYLMLEASNEITEDWTIDKCAICLEDYEANDSVAYSKHQTCEHVFHTDCISAWLREDGRNECPCCRGPYFHTKGMDSVVVDATIRSQSTGISESSLDE